MFIRKKKNRSGTTSVVVIQKHKGKFNEVKTIGISSDESEIESLCKQGNKWISSFLGNVDIFEKYDKEQEEKQVVEYLLSNIENILINGTQQILNNVFKLIGFDSVNDDILKHLVIARLSQPMSKSATVDYLKSYFDEDVELHKIYRYLDKLYNTQKEKIEQISIEHTKKILGGKIGLMFYDVTTLYFESDYGDEFRENGFSKDIRQGQMIKKGEHIGYVGNTGLSSGPHLHLGLYKNGVAVNPLTVIQKPKVDGLDGKEKAKFLANAQNIMKKFDDEIKNENRTLPTKFKRTTDKTDINIF